jgi:Holliday junction resolvasome RuvABC endonuclease subunit
MNILSVDQATNISGEAVLDENKKLIFFGFTDLSHMPKQTAQDQTEKRFELVKQIKELVFKYEIKLVTTEGVYFHSNPETHKKLAQTQSSLQDFCRSFQITCFSFENAGEWRSALGVKSKSREDYKNEVKKYVLAHYDIESDVEKMIFDKYHNPEKHKCFADLSKAIRDIQFDIYDSVGMSCAYFVKIGEIIE